jgi:hypothetical protein
MSIDATLDPVIVSVRDSETGDSESMLKTIKMCVLHIIRKVYSN